MQPSNGLQRGVRALEDGRLRRLSLGKLFHGFKRMRRSTDTRTGHATIKMFMYTYIHFDPVLWLPRI